MRIDFGTPVPSTEKPKLKEMLSITTEPYVSYDPTGQLQKTIVRINSSSLSTMQECWRKSKLMLIDELRNSSESPATLFGSAVHKALEVWYSRPRSLRAAKTKECVINSLTTESTHVCVRCESIVAFNEKAKPLQTLDFGDKRHPEIGVKLLHAYFDRHHDDPFEVMIDEAGPIVERRLEHTLFDSPTLKIIYFGTVDVILRNTETNTIVVCDHKTTSALGSEFYNRVKPNHQYTGYVWLAQRALGLKTDLFLVNGLQVAKTKTEFARQITQRTDEDFAEFEEAVVHTVRSFLTNLEANVWSMSAPNACNMWGSCQYRSICEAPQTLRPNITANLFQDFKQQGVEQHG